MARDPVTGEPRRSPLAMAVLALLAEEPVHVYRMQQMIRERAKDTVVNVVSRNSVHQVVDRLQRDGLALAAQRESPRGRTTYALTERGATTLRAWLDDMLARPREEFPEFPAALAFIALLSPQEVAARLEDRATRLRERLSVPGPTEVARSLGLPGVFLVEDEYKWAMTQAELAWVESLATELRAGDLRWPGPDVLPPR